MANAQEVEDGAALPDSHRQKRDRRVLRGVAPLLLELLPPNPAISAFVDDVRGALSEVTNEAHHPEHHEPVYRAADARAVLLTTATTLEYLATLLTPPMLP